MIQVDSPMLIFMRVQMRIRLLSFHVDHRDCSLLELALHYFIFIFPLRITLGVDKVSLVSS